MTSKFIDSVSQAIGLIEGSGDSGISEGELMIKCSYSTTKSLMVKKVIQETRSDILYVFPPRAYGSTKRFYLKANYEKLNQVVA